MNETAATGKSTIFSRLTQSAEHGWIPDALIRIGIRKLLRQRIKDNAQLHRERSVEDFILATQAQPIAVSTEQANEQHYEVPASFFQRVLGPRLKYSCGYWDEGTSSLEQAEDAALRLTCEHAELSDGMDILELGCGWGSLSLWMAEHYPSSRITAVSNSRSQREFIQELAMERGLTNLHVITCDINRFDPTESFDRVVSVEMFEHVRNHHRLLGQIHRWLRMNGKLFVHIFCHQTTPYLFQTYGENDWMGRYFFSGGMMPSFDLLPKVPSWFHLENDWKWNGNHYAKTCRAWLERQDAAERDIRKVMDDIYGRQNAGVWYHRWRMFFMACEELFAFGQGREWFVAHYLFAKSP